jgi:D-sedoheptulose 7-phosphate isomerase
MNYFEKYFNDTYKLLTEVNYDNLNTFVNLIEATSKAKKKVIFSGNGGSAAISSHLSVDFTKACGIRSINFNESDLITCFANDYGFENWVAEALKAYADKGDLLVLVSSSGESSNMIKAADQAIKLGLNLITFSGFNEENTLAKKGIINFWVNSKVYNHVEMVHHIWLVSLVDFIQKAKLNVN